jgi:hypothetical protein
MIEKYAVKIVMKHAQVWIHDKHKKYSVAWVREQTIPTERLPLVNEVNANFSG